MLPMLPVSLQEPPRKAPPALCAALGREGPPWRLVSCLATCPSRHPVWVCPATRRCRSAPGGVISSSREPRCCPLGARSHTFLSDGSVARLCRSYLFLATGHTWPFLSAPHARHFLGTPAPPRPWGIDHDRYKPRLAPTFTPYGGIHT